ncbi:MAG: lectin MOA-related protein [Methanosarcinales archaeon]|nr:lectin MOA-related protein [Methanosarcinales archaeon]
MGDNMSILDILWDLFRKPKSVAINDMPEISGNEVKEILKKYKTGNLWISDGIFKLVDTNNIKEFLDNNPVSKRKYITEFHDCDDFCYELMGNVSTWYPEGAFGMVWGNRAKDNIVHAWNFFVNETNEIMYVEPQTDEIFAPSTENVWIMIV